jgi:TetR/AcrR family transcriptional regulator, copper-responsive repressor
MVQKSEPEQRRRRGRPRAYDPDAALAQAIRTFWKAGYSGTSLDDLGDATGMNRPSLYAAFGDKRALYLKALEHYWQLSYVAMAEALEPDCPLPDALMRMYRGALAFYIPKESRPRGCFAISTATTEAVEDAKIRAAFAEGLRRLDEALETRFRLAVEQGELPQAADPKTLAALASATLYSLSIRARAGTPRAELEAFARNAVGMMCGRPPG